MPTSHKDLEFSFLQNMLLLRIKFVGISKRAVQANQNYQFLLRYSLIENSGKHPERFILTEKAHMYIRYQRRSKFRFWIPVIISIIALFGGYDVYTNPLLEQLLQAIAKSVKTILESLDAFF